MNQLLKCRMSFVLLLYFSVNVVYTQTLKFCTQNKIPYGTFGENKHNSTTLEGWEFNPAGNWYGWKEDHSLFYGENLFIDRVGHYEATVPDLNLCSNTPKKLQFNHFTRFFGSSTTLTVSLGGQTLLVLSYSGVNALLSFDSNDVDVKVGGVSKSNSSSVNVDGVRNKVFEITVRNFTGTNDNLTFAYEKKGGARAVYLDNIELYEGIPPQPSNPTSTALSLCQSSTANLNTVLPNISLHQGFSYEWHRVSSNPSPSTKVANPASVSTGSYYLYIKSSCDAICYSRAAGKSVKVTIVNDTEKPTFTVPVDMSFCVNDIQQVSYNDTTNGDVNTPPDYYQFGNHETSLDITGLQDNCCTSGFTISWKITPASNGTTISGTGQPSEMITDKKLWLDVSSTNPKSSYTEKIYTITYVVTDCNGNQSEPKTTTITITPRPKIETIN